MSDILDRIDDATTPVCGWCQEPLRENGPSLLYCNDRCQESWDQLQADKLVGYKEPTDLPVHVANLHEVHEEPPVTATWGIFLGMRPRTCPACGAMWEMTADEGSRMMLENSCRLCPTGWRDRIRCVFGDQVRVTCKIPNSLRVLDQVYLRVGNYVRRVSMELMCDTAAFDSALRCMDWGVPHV